jgi:hypothetical protein
MEELLINSVEDLDVDKIQNIDTMVSRRRMSMSEPMQKIM